MEIHGIKDLGCKPPPPRRQSVYVPPPPVKNPRVSLSLIEMLSAVLLTPAAAPDTTDPVGALRRSHRRLGLELIKIPEIEMIRNPLPIWRQLIA
jgi:hypothetical protein